MSNNNNKELKDNNIRIDKVINKFKEYCEFVGDLRFSFDEKEKSNSTLSDWIDEEFIIDNQFESCDIFNICSVDKNVFVNFIKKYYKECMEIYDYYENEYDGFGAYNYLGCIDTGLCYLCGLYFEEFGMNEEAVNAYFIVLCVHSLDNKEFVIEDTWYTRELKMLERIFDDIKDKLYPDWLTAHPCVTYSIGNYYMLEKKYDKAFEWFSLGASFNYEGRQSIEPFIAVGYNQYELGKMYLNGEGIDIDYEEAYDLFTSAAINAGQNYIPIMGDMYYEGLGKNKNLNKALMCYADYNQYNKDKNIRYRDLDVKQIGRLESLIEKVLSKKKIRFEDIILAHEVYKNRIYDSEKCNEIFDRMISFISEIPLDKRTKEMNQAFVEYKLNKLEGELNIPLKNVGGIPSNLKLGDTFTFGSFNGEDLHWRVLEKNKNGSFYVVSTKIIAKLNYDMAPKWLNHIFYKYSFTEEEKNHIVPHDYSSFLKNEETCVYLPTEDQLSHFEGDYYGEIEETEFAKSLASTKDILCFYANILKALDKGEEKPLFGFADNTGIYSIRPAMDIKIK